MCRAIRRVRHDFPFRERANNTTPQSRLAACGRRHKRIMILPYSHSPSALEASQAMGRGFGRPSEGCKSRGAMLIAVRLKPFYSKNRPLSHFERGIPMAKKETTNHAAPVLPMLKTVEQMSKVSGIEKINYASLWITANWNTFKTETAA